MTAFDNDVDDAAEDSSADDPDDISGEGVPESPEAEANRRLRAEKRRRAKRARRLPYWVEAPMYLVVTLVFTALIKAFVIQMYSIPSESMEPTTFKGDRVIVDQFSNWFGGAPARGQVVVFHDPGRWLPTPPPRPGGFDLADRLKDAAAFVGVLPDQKDDLLIKRIIGVGGDTVECRTVDGPVYVNGKALDEKYIRNYGTPLAQPCFNGVYKAVVPAGDLWVLGDNRMHSGDSAYNFEHQGPVSGFVPRSKVVGHVTGVISWLEDERVPDPPAPGGPGPGPGSVGGGHPGVVSTVPAP